MSSDNSFNTRLNAVAADTEALLDAIMGEASLFMRADEIERAWEIMDPIIAAAERGVAQPCGDYAVGSKGPACADEFLARTGREWLSMCHAK